MASALAREVGAVAGVRIDDQRAEAVDKRSGEIFNELNTDPRPIAGARSLLLALGDSKLPWAIATSSRPEQVRASLDALRLPHPPRITNGSHVEHAKPAPDLLLLAAEELGVPPGRSWYVGDSTWDMIAARSAGMVGVGVPYGAASKSDLLGAGAALVTTYKLVWSDLRRRGLLPAT